MGNGQYVPGSRIRSGAFLPYESVPDSQLERGIVVLEGLILIDERFFVGRSLIESLRCRRNAERAKRSNLARTVIVVKSHRSAQMTRRTPMRAALIGEGKSCFFCQRSFVLVVHNNVLTWISFCC